ncbi:hypothetical protein GJ496_006571 [Pomphorhynchus laevis]|nr:hypothetical protein GJ496_006571 [Pomphorhynchus laevis]
MFPYFSQVLEIRHQVSKSLSLYLPSEIFDSLIPDSFSASGTAEIVSILYLKKALDLSNPRNSDSSSISNSNDDEDRELLQTKCMVRNEIRINFKNRGAAKISFTLTLIRWRPVYELVLQQDGCLLFKAWAELSNQSMYTFTADEIQLWDFLDNMTAISSIASRQYEEGRNNEDIMLACYPGRSTLIFEIRDRIEFVPLSTLLIPFPASIQVKVSTEAYLENVITDFYEQDCILPMNRKFIFHSGSSFIPAGTVILRKDDRIIGKLYISSFEREYEHSCSVIDNETLFEKSTQEVNIGCLKVKIKMNNKLDHCINCIYSESCSERIQQQYTEFTDNRVQKNDNGFKVTQTIPAYSTYMLEYVVSLSTKSAHIL